MPFPVSPRIRPSNNGTAWKEEDSQVLDGNSGRLVVNRDRCFRLRVGRLEYERGDLLSRGRTPDSPRFFRCAGELLIGLGAHHDHVGREEEGRYSGDACTIRLGA